MAERRGIGETFIDGIVTGPNGAREELTFLVDSGAAFTVLPDPVWRKLELAPKRTELFSLADGSTIERAVSECHIQLPQGDATTQVILGRPGDVPLLGVLTLEALGLLLDPFSRTLRRRRHYMLYLNEVRPEGETVVGPNAP
jgi:predicted aspartyl protease